MTRPLPPVPAVKACAEVPACLEQVERPGGDAQALERLEGLERHLAVCAGCQRRHGARVRALRPLCTLRSRALPDGWLDDLGTRVLAGVRTGARHGGMSPAFLDAPASLARWRRVALAASVLVVTGAALLASGRLTLTVGRPSADEGVLDLREVLLERFDARLPSDDIEARPQPRLLLPASNNFYVFGPASRPGAQKPLPAPSPARTSSD